MTPLKRGVIGIPNQATRINALDEGRHGRGIGKGKERVIMGGEWKSANGQLGEPRIPGNPMVLQ
jgi:hypothetical protein